MRAVALVNRPQTKNLVLNSRILESFVQRVSLVGVFGDKHATRATMGALTKAMKYAKENHC